VPLLSPLSLPLLLLLLLLSPLLRERATRHREEEKDPNYCKIPVRVNSPNKFSYKYPATLASEGNVHDFVDGNFDDESVCAPSGAINIFLMTSWHHSQSWKRGETRLTNFTTRSARRLISAVSPIDSK